MPGLPRSRAVRRARALRQLLVARAASDRALRNTVLLGAYALAAVLAVVGAWRAIPVPCALAAVVAIVTARRIALRERALVDGVADTDHTEILPVSAGRGEATS
jgi:hypothetical protein